MSASSGGCQCGAVRYEVHGQPVVTCVCHCSDCRASSGAPSVAWSMFPEASVRLLRGEPRTYQSSEHAARQFCATCGTGLFYRNSLNLPGIVDVQSATLDNPADHPPQIHVQLADRLPWADGLASLPRHDRYPPPP